MKVVLALQWLASPSEIQLGQIKDKLVLRDEKRQIMIHISRKVQKICHSLFPYPPITLLC